MPFSTPLDDYRLEKILFTHAEIQHRVLQLGKKIAEDFSEETTLNVLAAMKGAWVFMADLARAIRVHHGPRVEYNFIRASTYGGEIKKEEEVHRQVRIDGLPEKLSGNLEGRNILIVDDILDQGFTLDALRAELKTRGAATYLCVMLEKELDNPTPAVAALRQQIKIDYCGFKVPDRWVVGYGLDIDEEFRDLPYVAVAYEKHFV